MDIQVAREELDFWEHFCDSPAFIAEVGGQESYDLEYAFRFDNFMTLNCTA